MRSLAILLYLKAVECSSETGLEKKLTHEREIKCLPEEYFGERHCCQNCNAGSYAALECVVEHGSPTCKPCTEGEDYMDKPNGYPNCLRCSHCDAGHGQTLLNACSITQNTICTCLDNYFCNKRASEFHESCSQCLPCTICKYGAIQECTPMKDAVCKGNHSRTHWGIVAAVLTVAVIVFICITYQSSNVSPRHQATEGVNVNPSNNTSKGADVASGGIQGCPPELADVDLRKYLVDIANKLPLETIRICIQKINSNSADIHDIDYSTQNAFDKKYKLLELWYLGHGKKGAFKELYETLQSCKRKVYAEEILEIVKAGHLNNAQS